ncbi:YdgA family protein [Pseudomonas sp. 32.2.56]|uniref:YdgA family protein n=1 Tax=Pseudomonas sp. 32.2.56 TaxID=2969303 RepID=UPI00214FCC72|nr:YdgA family protein [Pseudomonas sp. 32.2.56]MCR4510000.1 YdgA family protein [Pseudomonas sp. 32.2.56]
MKKVLGSAIGVIVALGALSTAGAWYTGQQLPEVLDTSIKKANDDMAKTLPAVGFSATVELLSLQQQLFSSDARYRIKLVGSLDGEAPANFEWTVTDHIEHGPFPLSRLKALKLLPVMATSNYALERSPELEKWFAASQDGAPLQGQVSLGYDRSMQGDMRLQPLQMDLDEQTRIDFSGLNIDFDTTADAEQITASGVMDSFKVSAKLASDESMRLEFKGMNLSSNTHKGVSDFYLGQNEVRLQQIELQIGENAPILFKDFVQRDETSEANQQLSARYSYDIGMISYQGTDIGSSQMHWSVKNLDAAALQSMVELYGTLLKDGKVDSESGMPQLTEAQTEQFKADLEKLLAGKPGLALEKLAFKTANGESSFSFGLDLDKPASFDLPAPELVKQLIAQLDAKLRVSKAMITDVIGVQAAIAGETDKEAIAQQAAMVGEMASGMAVASEFAVLQGEDISSSLHYANDQVTFNGKQMTVEQFVALAMSSGGGLAGMAPEAPAEEMLLEESEAESPIQ